MTDTIGNMTKQLSEIALKEGMKKLNGFWGINWVDHIPEIVILENRKIIDEIKGKKTTKDLVGWSYNRNVYVLDYEKLKTESSWELSLDQYKALIIHEMNHLFYGIVSKGVKGPLWLREGLSIYLSDQVNLGPWKRPESFKGFIDSGGENMKYAYFEGGYVVELLVNKFGKENMVQLVKNLEKETDFETLFKNTFGIELKYEVVNKLYLQYFGYRKPNCGA